MFEDNLFYDFGWSPLFVGGGSCICIRLFYNIYMFVILPENGNKFQRSQNIINQSTIEQTYFVKQRVFDHSVQKFSREIEVRFKISSLKLFQDVFYARLVF
eukprot:TRINITY_DN24998_c0_g1_i2.p5 TRINITY_DN24998_c0_g1~~TRINITY_DN24998_c0_g1_i2.p5  ORF type:complete len:101 (+),score=3.13 TRINITY_DN24998_c0_g1_i2:248-550(+)